MKTAAVIFLLIFVGFLMGGLFADFGEARPAYTIDDSLFLTGLFMIAALSIPAYIIGLYDGREAKK